MWPTGLRQDDGRKGSGSMCSGSGSTRDKGRALGRRALTRADIESYVEMFERPNEAELALYDPPSDLA